MLVRCVFALLGAAALIAPRGLPAAPQAVPSQTPRAWGFDVAGMDRKVRPGDNFAMYAFGGWFDTATIPEGAPAVGLRIDQMRSNERKIAAAIAKAVSEPTTPNRRLLATLYQSYLDTSTIDRRADEPLQADLASIRTARDKAAIARLMGRSSGSFGRSFFQPDVDADRNAPTRYALYLDQSGLGAGDRATYIDPGLQRDKSAYQDRVAATLAAAPWPSPTTTAAAVVALETRIAKASWSRADSMDVGKINHAMTVRQLHLLAPDFPWDAYFEGAGLAFLRHVIVEQQSAFPKIAKIFAQTPLPTLKAWMAFSVADQAKPYLSGKFRGEQQASPENRSAAAMRLLDAALVDPVAREYMAMYFPPAAKAGIEKMIAPIKAATEARLRRAPGLSDRTRAEALRKLARLRISIGYPDHWRDYSGLKLRSDDLYGNMQRISSFDWAWKIAKLNRPVDRGEWFMAPQAVGAQSNRSRLHLTFSAGLLQPPFFDPGNDMAVNYGAIGGVIGHEIGHLFDDQGANIDADGKVRNWWTASDRTLFDAKIRRLVAMLESPEMSSGERIDGRAVLSETMANLFGEQVALDAYHLQLAGRDPPLLDGFTGDQRFFLSFAQTWKAKARPEFWKEMGNQAPPEPSVNIVVRNIDKWYDAFAVVPGQKLYLPPEQRVPTW